MRKYCIVFICFCLILTLFGCAKDATVTQTDTPLVTEDVVSTKQESVPAQENPVQSQEEKPKESQADSKKEENKQEMVASKTPVSSAPSSQPEETTSTVKPYDGTNADLARVYPTFYTLESLNGWLTNGTQQPEKRDETLSFLSSNQTVTHYQPITTNQGNEPFFSFATVDRGFITYYYQFQDDPNPELSSFHIGVGNGVSEESMKDILGIFELHRENAKKNLNGSYFVNQNGIEYIVAPSDVTNATMILWWQDDDVPVLALLDGHYDALETVLGLCQLEKVTVKLNNDHVTQ